MLFFPATKRDIKSLRSCMQSVEKQVQDIHRVIYVDGNGKSYQTRLSNAEVTAKEAKRVALSRTSAMWTIMAFAILAIGGVLGYQMYRIDCICSQIQQFLGKAAIFSGF